MAWLFLHETLKKPNQKADTKRLNTSKAVISDGDVINESMETVCNSLTSDLEKGGECQPLLGSHDYRKMLEFHLVCQS